MLRGYLRLRMVIFTDPMDIRPDPTRMGRVLSDPFIYGADMGFIYKTRDGFGSGTDNGMPRPAYIYIYMCVCVCLVL